VNDLNDTELTQRGGAHLGMTAQTDCRCESRGALHSVIVTQSAGFGGSSPSAAPAAASAAAPGPYSAAPPAVAAAASAPTLPICHLPDTPPPFLLPPANYFVLLLCRGRSRLVWHCFTEAAAAVDALAAVATRRCRRWSRRFPS